MKRLNATCIAICIALLVGACGGGGGGDTTEPTLPADGGDEAVVDPTAAYLAKASSSAASMVVLATSEALGTSGTKTAKSFLDDGSCGFINSTTACPGGGSVQIVGYGLQDVEVVQTGPGPDDYALQVNEQCNIACAAFFANCSYDGITVDGRIEATSLVTALADGRFGFDTYLEGEPNARDDPGPTVADGVNPDALFRNAEVVIIAANPASPLDFDVTTYNASAIMDAVLMTCTAGVDDLICTDEPIPPPPDPKCYWDGGLVCDVGSLGDDYCATVDELGFPYEQSWRYNHLRNCLNGCCTELLPEDNVYWGTKHCSTNEDCRFPSFARFCLDNFCQTICRAEGDPVCNHGATCNMDLDDRDISRITRFADFPLALDHESYYGSIGLCIGPEVDYDIRALCEDGEWQQELGEICDATVVGGSIVCPPETVCDNCRCREANCTDGIDNDGNGDTDCYDVGCRNSHYTCLAENECPEFDGEPDQWTLCCSDDDDNNDNGYTDCGDRRCQFAVTWLCFENGEAPELCDDAIDNDLDGLLDCRDPDCQKLDTDAEDCPCDTRGTTCGTDDDCEAQEGVGSTCNTVEAQGFGCGNRNPNETCFIGCCSKPSAEDPAFCSDGFDNDEDDKIDCADPDCAASCI